MAKLVQVTDNTFDAEVLKLDIPVLVDFWAEWCGPCKMIAPLLEQIAEEYAGQVKVVKLDVDSSNQTAMQFGIRSIPTLLLFKNGQAVERLVGAMPKDRMLARIRPHLPLQ
jgi:thioredoxin 1